MIYNQFILIASFHQPKVLITLLHHCLIIFRKAKTCKMSLLYDHQQLCHVLLLFLKILLHIQTHKRTHMLMMINFNLQKECWWMMLRRSRYYECSKRRRVLCIVMFLLANFHKKSPHTFLQWVKDTKFTKLC